MILNEIEIEGFLSYKTNQVVNFEDITTALVGGKTASGKSSLFEGFAVCWYGKKASRGKLLDELINDYSSTAYIRTDIEFENIFYRRIRSWSKNGKSKNSLLELKDGAYVEIAKESDADVKSVEILGSWELFCTVYLKQKGIINFIEGDSSSRKSLLRELLSCEVYQKASEISSKQACQLQNEISIKISEIDSMKQSLLSEDVDSDQLIEYEKTLLDYQKSEDNFKKTIKDLEKSIEVEKIEQSKQADQEKKIQNLKELEKEIKQKIIDTEDLIDELQNDNETITYKLTQLEIIDYKDQLTTIQQNIDKIKHYEDMEVSKTETHEAEIIVLCKTQTETLSEISVLKNNIEDIDLKINRINIAGGYCPILEQECTFVDHKEHIDSLVKSKKVKTKKLIEKQSVVQTIKSKIEKLNDEIDKIEEANKLIIKNQNSLTNLRLKIENTQNLLKKTTQQIAEHNKQIEKNNITLKKHNKTVVGYRKELEKNQVEIQKFKKYDDTKLIDFQDDLLNIKSQLESTQKKKIQIVELIGGLKADLKNHKSTRVKIKQSNNELLKLKKQKTIQEKLNFVFGKNGIQKSIMKSAVPELEYLSTKLMQKFCPYKDIAIKFELDPKTKDGELKSQGGLDILIVENGKEKNLSLYSGGETTQITFSIYLSLAELSSRRAGKRMQTLIIDERISGLDEDGINRFAEIIDVIRLRYKRCIVITHITQLKDLFDRQMLVSNTEDGSIID